MNSQHQIVISDGNQLAASECQRLTDRVRAGMLEYFADTSPEFEAVARQALAELEQDLGYPQSVGLERLLIEQIVTSWLNLQIVMLGYAKWNAVEPRRGMFWEKKANAATRRYLSSIETLARVRRLALPALQVNIAQQQVNQLGL